MSAPLKVFSSLVEVAFAFAEWSVHAGSMELHFHSFLACAAAIAGLLCNNLLHAKVGECNHQFFCHGVLPWDVCCQRGNGAHDLDTLDCMGAVVVSLENFQFALEDLCQVGAGTTCK